MSLLEFHHVYHSSEICCTEQNYLILDRFRYWFLLELKVYRSLSVPCPPNMTYFTMGCIMKWKYVVRKSPKMYTSNYLRVLCTQLTTNSNNRARVLERGLLIIYEVQHTHFPQICAKVSVLCLSKWSLISKDSISKSNVFPSRINSKFS